MNVSKALYRCPECGSKRTHVFERPDTWSGCLDCGFRFAHAWAAPIEPPRPPLNINKGDM